MLYERLTCHNQLLGENKVYYVIFATFSRSFPGSNSSKFPIVKVMPQALVLGLYFFFYIFSY